MRELNQVPMARALRLSGSSVERILRCTVMQSPLAGVSDRIFRALVRRWAPDALLFTEMVNATSLELGHGRGKVEELSEEMGGVSIVKLNIDDHPDTPGKYGVRGIPTMILFKDGQPVETKVGAAPKAQIKSWLEASL